MTLISEKEKKAIVSEAAMPQEILNDLSSVITSKNIADEETEIMNLISGVFEKESGDIVAEKKKKKEEEDDEDEDGEEESDDWDKPEEEEEEWDPDFDEFDVPKKGAKKSTGSKKSGEEDDFKFEDDEFDDLFEDDEFDDDDDDF